MRAVVVAFTLAASHPMRILAVTGCGATARTTARATFSSSGQSRSSDEPPFLLTTLLTGQPKFRSMKSGCFHSITMRAASPRWPGSAPKSCTPSGRSASQNSRYSSVRSLRRKMPSAETNSVTITSAPCSLQSWRKMVSVTPAMGAR
jgi:hypothetical protein